MVLVTVAVYLAERIFIMGGKIKYRLSARPNSLQDIVCLYATQSKTWIWIMMEGCGGEGAAICARRFGCRGTVIGAQGVVVWL